MAVYKRYNGKRIRPSDPNWDKGTWVVEFNLRGHRVKEAIPEARTGKQAEQVETQIKQLIHQEDVEPLRVVSADGESVPVEPAERTRDPHLASLEQELRAALGAKVDVHAAEGRGRIVIHFASHEEFERLRAQLNASAGQIKSHVA